MRVVNCNYFRLLVLPKNSLLLPSESIRCPPAGVDSTDMMRCSSC